MRHRVSWVIKGWLSLLTLVLPKEGGLGKAGGDLPQLTWAGHLQVQLVVPGRPCLPASTLWGQGHPHRMVSLTTLGCKTEGLVGQEAVGVKDVSLSLHRGSEVQARG